MGQKYVPELHDPDRRKPEGQSVDDLSGREVKLIFDALVARLDDEERTGERPR